MNRWEPNARGRLEAAALDLYVERGFAQTTVAEIAKQAGLTERTYFRHFADKREVLFGGSEELAQLIAATIADQPESAAPIDAAAAAVEAMGDRLQPRRERAVRRQGVIAANPELQERELTKLASMATTIADALRERGTPSPTAGLAAETAIGVFKVAFERWTTAGTSSDLAQLIRDSFTDLKALLAEVSP
ncbi:TetR/AcrR family transcriptional regulator [Streptodolium elevatio]|uniref:Helix-turn-helix domain-containing protein n=1 Tax=Streptodolium elevatio TaxID=3157996 RepID=A0ABV3DFV6_9ACTN